MEREEIKQRIIEIQKDYPELTLDNQGYEYLSKEIIDAHKEPIQELSELIKIIDPAFVEFNNFKPRKNNNFDIRFQCRWDKNFIGVNYIDINDIYE